MPPPSSAALTGAGASSRRLPGPRNRPGGGGRAGKARRRKPPQVTGHCHPVTRSGQAPFSPRRFSRGRDDASRLHPHETSTPSPRPSEGGPRQRLPLSPVAAEPSTPLTVASSPAAACLNHQLSAQGRGKRGENGSAGRAAASGLGQRRPHSGGGWMAERAGARARTSPLPPLTRRERLHRGRPGGVRGATGRYPHPQSPSCPLFGWARLFGIPGSGGREERGVRADPRWAASATDLRRDRSRAEGARFGRRGSKSVISSAWLRASAAFGKFCPLQAIGLAERLAPKRVKLLDHTEEQWK